MALEDERLSVAVRRWCNGGGCECVVDGDGETLGVRVEAESQVRRNG